MSWWYSRYLNQKATYWEPTGGKDAYGMSKFYKPRLLDCRWEDSQELFINAFGQEELSQSKIHVDTDLVVGGYLIQGDYRDMDDSTTTTETTSDEYRPHPDAMEIRNFQSIPNIKGTRFVRTAWLKRTWV